MPARRDSRHRSSQLHKKLLCNLQGFRSWRGRVNTPTELCTGTHLGHPGTAPGAAPPPGPAGEGGQAAAQRGAARRDQSRAVPPGRAVTPSAAGQPGSARVHRAIHQAVTPPPLRRQRQPANIRTSAVRAQHRINRPHDTPARAVKHRDSALRNPGQQLPRDMRQMSARYDNGLKCFRVIKAHLEGYHLGDLTAIGPPFPAPRERWMVRPRVTLEAHELGGSVIAWGS
jgi:hypothetical protein